MKRVLIVLLMVMFVGCASFNKQKFNTDTDQDETVTEYYPPVQQPDGEWVTFIKTHTVDTFRGIIAGRNISSAMPFQATNNANAHLDMTEGADENGDVIWTVNMGQEGEIDGGDIAPVIEATGGLAGAIADGIVDVSTVGATSVIEDLTGGNN